MEPLALPRLLAWMALAAAVGVVVFHAVAGFYHLRYYVLRAAEPEAWKCQPRRKLPARFQRKAVLLSTFNLVFAGALTGVLLDAIERGLPVPIYHDVSERGWAYTLLSTVGLFVVIDCFAYWFHRALHHPVLYQGFHRAHHQYVATTPYCTAAIHPAVFLGLQVISFAPVLVLPFHAVSIGVVFFYILVFNIIDHSGVSLSSRLPWQAPSDYHDDHHAHFHVNFGQHLMLWDRIHGTLRRQGRTYGAEHFGGRGALVTDGGAGAAPDDYVEYGPSGRAS